MVKTTWRRISQRVRDDHPGRLRPRMEWWRVVVILVGLALWSAPAAAQSAVDGFNPGADSAIRAYAVQADGKIVVGGQFSTLGGQPRLSIGRLNADGSLDAGFNPGADGPVRSLAVQADGKILVGGDFNTLAGQPRAKIGRLNPDGTLDTGFDPGANGSVFAFTLQPDGRILVGGGFTALAAQPRAFIGRLNTDGTLDTAFNPGPNGFVFALAAQPDGKIVVGGFFSTLGGQPCSNIGRLNVDGSVDAAFNSGTNNSVFSLVSQADGKIVVGGNFSSLGGQPRSNIGRLNADGGLDIAFNPGANNEIYAAAMQADGKILVGGNFSTLGGQARGFIARVNPDGTLDAGFNPNANSALFALAVQADGKILAGGFFNFLGGQPRNFIGRLYPGGEVDATVNPVTDRYVSAIALQPDGRIVVGGDFTTLGGQSRGRLGRLTPDGRVDMGFNPGADSAINCLVVQADGKILVGGVFATLGGQSRTAIGRLNQDGSLDAAFNPGTSSPSQPPEVRALAIQPDGKILVGGVFTTLGGQPRNYIGRLNADGTVDAAFNPNANSGVNVLAVQSDGKILVGGVFTTLSGQPRNYIGRLNADGTVDTSFNPGATSSSLAQVQVMAVQPDGKILVGGSFSTLGGQPRSFVGRLNADGTVDAGFNPGANNEVYALACQSDGKILVAGNFTTLGGQPRSYIGRLNADGTLDTGFNPGANSVVFGLAVQPDGKILVGGFFSTLGGQTRDKIGRLSATSAAPQNLSVNAGGTTITWTRSGSGPEVNRVTFERSTDGVTYTPLGTGTRIAGGWQLTGVSLGFGQNLYLRARGFQPTGLFNGSGSIIESVRNIFLSVNGSLNGGGSICTGQSATLTVTVTGGTPPYTVNINNGVGTVIVPNSNPFNVTVSPTSTTSYSITGGSDAGSNPVTPGGGATVTVSQLPGTFNVTGGGSFCTGGPGVTVGLSGSQTGVNYQLFNGITAVGGPVAGTGSALSFGTQTTAGVYNVVATSVPGGCTATMGGTATVTVNPLPAAFTVTGGGAFCSGGTGVAVGLSGSQTGVNYQLFNGASQVGGPVAGTGSALTFGNQTAGGTYTVTATNATTACTATMTGTAVLTLNPVPVVTNPSTSTGTAGTAFSQTFTASGGTEPYAFALASGTLPTGLFLSSAGVISGTPTQTGTFPITMRATDANGCQGTGATYTLVIACPTITLTPTTLPGGTAGTAYNQTITATPAGGAYSFAVTAGTLPAGLSLTSAGVLAGTPTAVGTFNFTVTATGFGTCTGSQAYSLVIACPTITLTPTTLPGGTAGTAYNQTITATPAGGAYTFAVTAGTLPAGLSLTSAGVLAGTPTAAGTFNFTVTATGFGSCTGSQAYSLVIACPTITLTPTTLPGGAAGTAYNQTLTASPAGTYSFAVTAGSLPAGLTLTSGGVLSGTPTAQGSFNFTVTATGFGTCTGVQAYSLVIACPTITVNPASLPGGAAGTAYVQSITATGTLGAANFTVSAGSLPPGLTLTAGGTLSGTPTAAGTFNFTVRATDTNAGTNTCFGERAYTVAIACPTITVNPASLPAGTAAVAYSQTITATGTLGAPAFTVSTGTLPAGLTLNPTTGVLSGTPTVIGTFNFTIRATDTNPGTSACFGERPYSLVLTCPTITVSPVTLPAANVGVAYSQTVTASGGIAPYSFAVTAGSLPPGLTLDGTTGAITGTATTVGTFNFTITATDANKCTGTRNYTVAVGGVELSLLYVADTDNSRIQVFDGTNWSLAPRSSGVVGSAAGQFRSPEGVTATRTNQIYVADTGNNRIHWYNGFTWADFATIGSGLNQVRAPQAVAVDVTGQFLFVADTGNNRVLRFNANAPNSAGVVLANSGGLAGQVNGPRGLAVDGLGNLFVADTGNSRILRIANATTAAAADTGTIVTSSLRAPEGVALDNEGNLYIADTGNSRIMQLPGGASGTPVTLATLGTALGAVRSAEGVTVTNFAAGPLAGRQILVGDTGNSRVQARPLGGTTWSIVGGTGSALGQFRSPSKVR